jgi:hypothetical protein
VWNLGKGSERRKSLRRKSKKEHRKSKIWKGSEHWKIRTSKAWKGSERRKSNLSDFQILMKCQLPMA